MVIRQVLKKLEQAGLHQAVISTTNSLQEIPPPTLEDGNVDTALFTQVFMDFQMRFLFRYVYIVLSHWKSISKGSKTQR